MKKYLFVCLKTPSKKLEIHLTCGCLILSQKQLRIKRINKLLISFWNPLNLDSNRSKIKMRIAFIVYFLKILVKRPDFVLNTKIRYFKVSWEEVSSDHKHTLRIDNLKFWISNGTLLLGFDFPLLNHENALDGIRNIDYDAYIFTGDEPTKVSDFLEVLSSSLQNLQLNLPDEDNYIDKWNATKFYKIKNGLIRHGTLAINAQGFAITHQRVQLNESETKKNFVGSYFINNEMSISTFKASRFEKHPGIAVFIPYSSNLYHFLLESLRTLIYCQQNEIDFDHLVISSDISKNFLLILNSLQPNLNILMQDPEVEFQFDAILVHQYDNPYANRLNAFSKNSQSDFLLTDENRCLQYLRNKLQLEPVIGDKLNLLSIRPKFASRGFIQSINLIRFASKWDLKYIDLGCVDFIQLVGVLQQTNLFICESGAGILNCIFLPDHSQLLEISYGNGDSWECVAGALNLQYSKIQINSLQYRFFAKWLDVYFFPKNSLEKHLS